MQTIRAGAVIGACDGHIFKPGATQASHLLANQVGLPGQLPGQGDVDQIGTTQTTSPCQGARHRPDRLPSVRTGLQDLYHLARAVPVLSFVWFIQSDPNQLPRQGKTYENHSPVQMGHTPALVRISFNAKFNVHIRLSYKPRGIPILTESALGPPGTIRTCINAVKLFPFSTLVPWHSVEGMEGIAHHQPGNPDGQGEKGDAEHQPGPAQETD